jgi:hypothetical protein
MDHVHTSLFRPAVAGMIVLLASPVLAQAHRAAVDTRKRSTRLATH